MSNVESRIVAVVFNTKFPTQAELLYFELGSGTGPPLTLTPISEACGALNFAQI